ncbi:MAG TPA: DUF1731 domain-containing protein, partial [Nannocystaceae bacterium]|nr:DUF1731 domain-containing protein [Nannocystaceae bacterium]
TAPTPVTNRELTRTLARALHRPQFAFAPAFALQLMLGEAAQIVLHGQRVLPKRAEQLGFRFQHRELPSAFHELLHGRAPLDVTRVDAWPHMPYLDERHPRWKLETRIRLATPLDRVLAFFSHSQNLGAMTPANMRFATIGHPPEVVHVGLEIQHRVYLGRIGLRWLTRIDRLDERGFADSQLSGPYRAWHHEHEFVAEGETTVMTDRVWYALPLAPFSTPAHALWVAPQLRTIFRHRTRCAVLRFGDADARA